MASSGSGYDLSASTFSPDGRIFQIEYANKAVEGAGTVLGIKCSDGVVLAAAAAVQHKMVVPLTASYKRIHTVDSHAGIASTGFLPDARQVVVRAIEECSDYHESYDVKMPANVLAERLGAYVHYFTLHGALRPFGASSVLAVYDADQDKYCLHMVEPNGAAYSYFGVAVGKGKQAAKTELEKLNLHRSEQEMTCATAVQHCAKILTMLHQENKDLSSKPLVMEMSWICKESKNRHAPVPVSVIDAAKAWAAEQLEEEDDDEEEEDEAMEE